MEEITEVTRTNLIKAFTAWGEVEKAGETIGQQEDETDEEYAERSADYFLELLEKLKD